MHEEKQLFPTSWYHHFWWPYHAKNFLKSLQYLKKEMRDEVDFLHADTYQSFRNLMLSISIYGQSHSCQMCTKKTSWQNLYNISRKKRGLKLIIGADKHQNFEKRSSYHIWWVWRGIRKVFKISKQYLKKEISNKIGFLNDEKDYRWYYLFWWIWPGTPKVPRHDCHISRKKLGISWFLVCAWTC